MTASRIRSAGRVVAIRLILYLVLVGFFLQHLYFGEGGSLLFPRSVLWALPLAFLLGLAVMAGGNALRRADAAIALAFVIDTGVVTGVAVASGGFNSIFVSFYLPVIFMAGAWLPRRFTALFPAAATLGATYIALGHLSATLDISPLSGWFSEGVILNLRRLEQHTVVSTLLIFSVLFFITSYLAGVLGQAISSEQRRNAAILESMTEGVAVARRDGRLSYANSEFLRIFPGTAGAGTLRPVLEALFPGAGDGMEELRKALPEGGDGVVVLTPPDRAERPPVEVRVSALRLREGRRGEGLLFLATDLSLRRRVEQAERGLEKHLAITAMATGLAHEIRNPLASLRGAVQEVGRSLPPGSEDRMLMDIVISESDRLDGVVGRFLDFSRESEPRLARRTLSPLLNNAIAMLSRSHESAGMEIRVAAKDDPEVVCDADRLMEVFFNLALNACQFAPRPGGRLDIALRRDGRMGTEGVEILFEDNGPGFDEKTRGKLFAPFFTTRPEGTGMGLAVSRKQMALHGGTIGAENRAGGGARFRVWLPLEQRGEARVAGHGTRILRKD